jgi:hypothetical protein
MKIAPIAPLMESVPPRPYGGTERIGGLKGEVERRLVVRLKAEQWKIFMELRGCLTAESDFFGRAV